MTQEENLVEKIAALVHALEGMDVPTVEAALDAVSDDLATNEPAHDLWMDSVLDGIRWGHRAAAVVELGGGTILRLRAPGGVGVTHEWQAGPSEATRARILAQVAEAIEGTLRAEGA